MNALLPLLLAGACAAQDFDKKGAAAAQTPPPVEAAAGKPVEKKSGPPQNVILITWDGVRTEDFFANKADPLLETADTAPLLPKLWGARAAEGTIWGEPSGSFTIANIAGVSLPAYQSIMAGYMQPCLNNKCGRIKNETLPEHLLKQGFAADKVAVIASWNQIAEAAEHVQGTVHVDAGEGGKTRRDTKTWPLAMDYLDSHRPRFLWISLNDSDDYGHSGEYKKYMKQLRLFDGWLDGLFTKLDGLGEYGQNTTVLLTTDHGRGLGEDWKHHNSMRPSAVRIWAYARGPKTAKGARGAGPKNHSDLRPTIEALLGVTPFACPDPDMCGGGLPEVLGQGAAAAKAAP